MLFGQGRARGLTREDHHRLGRGTIGLGLIDPDKAVAGRGDVGQRGIVAFGYALVGGIGVLERLDDSDGAVEQGEIRWDWPLYEQIGAAMKAAAKELGVPIVWGGDWASFRDGPHFELDRTAYP